MTAPKPDSNADKNGFRPFAHSIRIEAVPPSANKYQRMHWAVKKKLRTRFHAELFVASLESGKFGYPHAKMRVQINVHSKGATARRLDPDNLWGGCKPLIDAMRDVGLIRNDSPKWLDLGVSEIRTDGPFTEILFEEFT